MVSKVLGVVGALSSCLVVQAADIMTPAECLVKGSLFGNNKLSGTTKTFNQEDALEAFLPIHYTPYEYSLCIDLKNNNKLVSFTIKYANEDVSSTFAIPRVGPNGGTCMAAKAQGRAFPQAYNIFQDGMGINAVQVLPRAETPALFTMGKFDRTTNESKTIMFTAD